MSTDVLGTIRIPAAFNGPPHSGNGGYTAGRVAAFLDGPHAMRISSPIPLETDLTLHRDGDVVKVLEGERLILTARPNALTLTPPKPPSLAAAKTAHEHPINFGAGGPSTCFVCGRNRAEGDGLRVWCGKVDGFDGAVEVWTPHQNFANAQGKVRPEVMWSALDCPGGYCLPEANRRVLLGEMTADIYECPPVEEPTILVSWHDRSEGRKHFAGTAMFSAGGKLLAQADTLWIELKPEHVNAMFG